MLIDLKNCIVYLSDGNEMTGAINLMAGYMAGATSIAVDGFTGIVPPGAFLTIDGVDGYTVVSTTETSGNTTNIVFTPGLTGAVADEDVVIAGSRFVRIKVGEGTITWSEKKPREFKKDRGRLDAVRDADEEPMEVAFTMNYEFITASTGDTPSPEDVLKRRGEADDWDSADSDDPCAPFCVDIRILHTPPNCDTEDKELVILRKFYYESLDHDPKAGTIQCAGKCNATEAEVSRIAQ
jgi:hypothetical protein